MLAINLKKIEGKRCNYIPLTFKKLLLRNSVNKNGASITEIIFSECPIKVKLSFLKDRGKLLISLERFRKSALIAQNSIDYIKTKNKIKAYT